MKIRLFFSMMLLMALVSCQGNKPVSTNSPADTEHNASVSLDWNGVYKGVLPCADCEGIETTLVLNSDKTYQLTQLYQGKETTGETLSGTFEWDKSGNIVMLSDIIGASNRYFVGENTLTYLDMDGNKITGALADFYVLHKVEGPDTDFQAKSLTDVKWVLTELFGKTIPNSSDQDSRPFIVFEETGKRIYGSGGCNLFNGTFEADAYRITLTGLATTMKACPEMETEGQFFQALNDCDNYTIADGILSLNKARMAPMAKLKATPLDKE